MNRSDFDFERPKGLEATAPPEARGVARDGVRLLVTDGNRSSHHSFRDLPELLAPGDLLVVNESATLAASLPVRGPPGDFLLNVCTHYGGAVWLAEPRWGVGGPGPVPLTPGCSDHIGRGPVLPDRSVPRHRTTLVLPSRRRPFRRDDRIRTSHPLRLRVERVLSRDVSDGLRPGPGERRDALRGSSLHPPRAPGAARARGRPRSARPPFGRFEPGGRARPGEIHRSTPNRSRSRATTADRVNATRKAGHRVIAVGTTVLRALETSWDGCGVVPRRGFTRLTLGPGRPIRSVDGLVSGFHDPRTSHLALLFAFAGADRIRAAYAEAVAAGYLWHEFGDSHLIWGAAAE